MSNVTIAIKKIGLTPVARKCGIKPSSVSKWRNRGALPRTDYTGETDYAGAIAELSQGEFSREDLLRPLSQSRLS